MLPDKAFGPVIFVQFVSFNQKSLREIRKPRLTAEPLDCCICLRFRLVHSNQKFGFFPLLPFLHEPKQMNATRYRNYAFAAASTALVSIETVRPFAIVL